MKTPLIVASLSVALLAPLATFATHDSPEEIEYRIKKVGRLNVVEAQAPVVAEDGSIDPASVYTSKCSSCHASGVLGAPILGDAGQWAPRIAQSMNVLYDHAINGFNNMPARGGAMDLSDEHVKQLVDYMVAESQ